VEENILISKQYNNKVYLVNQDYYDKVDPKQLEEIETEITSSKENLDKLKSENTKLSQDLKNLTVVLTNEELDVRLTENRKEVNEMEKKLRGLESKELVQIPMDKVNEVESCYEKVLEGVKKIKKVHNNILDAFTENLEISKKELIVLFCF
jgi:hypothetical protein